MIKRFQRKGYLLAGVGSVVAGISGVVGGGKVVSGWHVITALSAAIAVLGSYLQYLASEPFPAQIQPTDWVASAPGPNAECSFRIPYRQHLRSKPQTTTQMRDGDDWEECECDVRYPPNGDVVITVGRRLDVILQVLIS